MILIGKLFLMSLILVLFQNCQSEKSVEEITSLLIEEHGGENYKHSEISFEFRGKQFNIYRNGNEFKYERVYTDTAGQNVRELIANKGKQKFTDGVEIELDKKGENKIDGAVNSVIYFTLLPFPLADKAAIKKVISEDSIEGEEFYLLEVTFKQEGGGRDYEDRYVYWINKNSNQMEYFAYYFHVNGGGSRFRKMVNSRRVGGILFFDQINYSSDKIDTDIENYSSVFKEGKLEKVSEIIIENIVVKSLR